MKKIRIKKSVIIISVVVLAILLIIGLYFFLLSGRNDNSKVTFTVKEGASKFDIVDDLKDADLIRSKTATLVYLIFNKDKNLQAGTYSFNRNMSVSKIMDKISRGDIKVDSLSITFVEGDNINDYIKLISTKLDIPETEVKSVFEDKEFMESLVEKYEFLTDEVLNGNIYYALEGYLFPDTYEFLDTASVEDVITRMLDNTKVKLDSIEINSDYTVHEILSMASIVELEAVNESDRRKVAQVIYTRLNMGKGLGTDVTTYYAVHKEMGKDSLTMNDLSSSNPYNTSEMNTSMAGKLPVGPICNPSLESIKAVINPSDTNYVFFVANTCTGEVFFTDLWEEHSKKSQEFRNACTTN